MKFRKHFFWLNLLFLSFLGMLLWLKGPDVSWVRSPLAELISVYVLSAFLHQGLNLLDNNWIKIGSLILFILGHYLLTGVFTIILQRFLRVTEEYTFQAFEQFLSSNTNLWVDGIIWWIIYQAIFLLMRNRNQLQSTIEINHQLEQELNETHKKQLRNELNPHFLFNAMNSIAMKVRLKENHTAVEMIAALNELLRVGLRPSKKELIPIKHELALLEKYILIENHRFDQIDVKLSFDEEIHNVLIPEMILQPLVENAFKHIHSAYEHPPYISISGKRIDDQIEILVYNHSNVSKIINFESSGIGLPNVINRLKRNYGLDFQFKSYIESDGVAFKLSIPFKLK